MKHLAALLAPLFLLLSACAGIVKSPQQAVLVEPSVIVDSSASYWWRYDVHLSWPEQQEPSWYMDMFLADQLFSPVLLEYSPKLPLWRFHRRAIRDNSGHRFALLFFSDAHLAKDIYQSIEQRYRFLESIGLHGIDHITKSDLANPPPAGIAAASDGHWYVEIQQTWPYFIKGVSESWLRLVQALARPELVNSEIPDFDALSGVYSKIENQVKAYWRNQGGHAYLHHLNAIFGYEDVIITERKLMRF